MDEEKNTKICKVIKEIFPHEDNIIHCLLKLKDGRLASGSEDSTIKIINFADNYKLDLSLTGHTKAVRSMIQLENGTLISSSEDKSIKFWTIKKDSFTCDHTIENAHDDKVIKLVKISEEEIASISTDSEVKIWKTSEPFESGTSLDANSRVVAIYKPKDHNYLISIGEDKRMLFWNLETYKCDKIINGVNCFKENSICEMKDGKLFIGGYYKLTIIDLVKQKYYFVLEKETLNGIYCPLLLSNGQIIYGIGAVGMYLYSSNTRTTYCLEFSEELSSTTYTVNMDEHTFVTVRDNKLKIYNY